MAYSRDYKQRAVAYKQEGHTFKQLREAFGIPPETYYDWKEKLESGYYEIPIKRERKRKIDKDMLRQAVARQPDAYLYELAEQFNCTASAVFYALAKLNITRKKRLLPIRKNRKSCGPNILKG
jgi:transposase-like protein